MKTPQEFLSLTEAEKALDYYENHPSQPRCKIVPVPNLCGVVWRLDVKPRALSTSASAGYVAPDWVGARAASVGAA
jgi:hypothetical protein